jgi:DNA repair protein RadC
VCPPLPPDDPSERLTLLGPDALTTVELLTLLLPRERPGPNGVCSREAVARRLLDDFGALRQLAQGRPHEMAARGPLGREASVRLAAAFALGRRVHTERLRPGRKLQSTGDVFEAFHARLRDLKKERFLIVLLDGRRRVIREEVVSEGILTASLVHPREVFAPAIRAAAGSVLLVHNHPSGDPEPSPEDHDVTRRLSAVGELMGIRVEDHLVIGDGQYVSFLERGLI